MIFILIEDKTKLHKTCNVMLFEETKRKAPPHLHAGRKNLNNPRLLEHCNNILSNKGTYLARFIIQVLVCLLS